jgi:hypothetical protein
MQSIRSKVPSREAARHVWATLGLPVMALLFAVQSVPAQENGSIQGKVTDSSGAPILGAVVTAEGGGDSRTTVTDMEGTFQISLPKPGNYNVKISASGLSDWTTENVAASAAPEAKPLLAVMQVAPAVTTVTVGLSPEELAQEQVKRETQQRLMGVIPNYFVAYDKNAAPLSPKQKLDLSLKTLIDPATFAAVGLTAGIQQSMNSYHQFGQGSEAPSVSERLTAPPPPTSLSRPLWRNQYSIRIHATSIADRAQRRSARGMPLNLRLSPEEITGNGSRPTPECWEQSARPNFQPFTIRVLVHNTPYSAEA